MFDTFLEVILHAELKNRLLHELNIMQSANPKTEFAVKYVQCSVCTKHSAYCTLCTVLGGGLFQTFMGPGVF